MKLVKYISIFLIAIIVIQCFSFMAPRSFTLYVFYDSTANRNGAVDVTTNTMTELAGDSIDIIYVPVDDPSDLWVKTQGPSFAAFVFHGADEGLTLNLRGDSEVLMTWSQLGQYIDKTHYEGYFVMSCDSTRVDDFTQKEKVLTFVGDVDAKVASLIAMAHLQYVLREYSPSAARDIIHRIVNTFESEGMITRFFKPVVPLTDYGIEETTLYSLIINNMEYYLDAIRGQTRLIITEKSYQYTVHLAFEEIMDLVTVGMYSAMKDLGGVISNVLDDLDDVIQDFINGEVKASTFKSAISAVLDLWDLTDIAREFVIGERARNILKWADLAFYVANIIYTLYSVKAQVESDNYGDRTEFADSLAIVMDDESYREVVPAGILPEQVSVYDAVANLLDVLKGPIKKSDIRVAADSVIEVCKKALIFAKQIGGDIQYLTIMLLEGVRDSAQALYDSGADYLDRYASDNWYYKSSWSVSSDWWAGKLTISFTFTNPITNQIPFYKISTNAKEDKTGNTASSSKTYGYYLLPGESYSDSYKLNYDRWKGYKVIFSWSITFYSFIDIVGDYIKGDKDGDGISDYDELHSTYGYRTCPTKYDTDGDGYSDKVEIDSNTDPLNPFSHPGGGSGDGDGGAPPPIITAR